MSRPITPTPPLSAEEWEDLQRSLQSHCSIEEMERRVERARKHVEEMSRPKTVSKLVTPELLDFAEKLIGKPIPPYYRFMSLAPMYPKKPVIYLNNA